MVTNAHHIINSALTGSRSPAGPRRLGTATRISASLFRRLSAFFGSTPSQGPKVAKCGVLIPGPGMFVNVQYVSTDFPLFPSRLARSVLGQNWVRSCREDKRHCQSRKKNLPQIPKNEKAFAPHVRVRCIILPRRKRAKTRAGRSDDISCRKKYISCRRPHKSRKICYTEEMNLKNRPGAPPDP